MEPPTIKFVGAPCGRHGPYTFYKAFKYQDPNKEGRLRIISLGEFFFARISQEAPLCCAELQLLWEDKNNENILLSSVRLYFLPEHTPNGRQVFHGEDEVLADGEKVVLKIEDLLKWIVHPDDVAWSTGTRAIPVKMEAYDQEAEEKMLQMFAANNSGLQLDDIRKEKKLCENGEKPKCQIIILSYSQYCRYKSVLKRLESVENTWFKNALVCAIGGFTLPRNCDKTYVLFCKDTFEHPDLQDHEFRQDNLAPNLKGRPRKKKLNFHKLNGGDSSDSETSSLERSFSRDTISKEVKKRHSTRMRGDYLSREEQAFFEALYKYMKDRNTPIERIPSLGFKQLDLYAFYTMSQKLGGYDKVCEKKLWKGLYDKLGGNPGNTSAATCTRRHYEKLLLPFERSRKGQDFNKYLPKEKEKKKGRPSDEKKDKLDGENRNGKNGVKIKSENEKTGVNNKKPKNTMLADRNKPLQVLREQRFQKQQNQRLNIRKTVKHEIEMRNQQKEGAEIPKIKNEGLQYSAKNGTNHVIDKIHPIENKNSELKTTNGRIVNGASLNSRVPPTGILVNDQKIPGNKIVGPDGKITTPSEHPSIIPPNQQNRSAFLRPNLPQQFAQQHTNRMFLPHQVSRDSPVMPSGSNGRPSVIQHTARHGPPSIYGPPGLYNRETDPRKRPYPFSDPSNSVISEMQPFPRPPPAHSNSHRSYIQSDLRNFSAPVDSIKRLRMDEGQPPLANHCINKYRPVPVKEEMQPEVIDLECNETLEPVDFSIKPDRTSDDIKTIVPETGSDDGPLCLVTHRRKDVGAGSNSHLRPTPSFQPWQGTPKGAIIPPPPPSHHGVRSASGINHVVKHDILNHRTSPGTPKPQRPVPHSPVALGQNRQPSGAGYLYGQPAQTVSAGLSTHKGMSPSPNNSRSASSSSLSVHRQPPAPPQQQQQQHSTARSMSSITSTKPELKIDGINDSSVLHPAFFPMGSRLVNPGMIPLQVAPQLLYPAMLPPTTPPGIGGKDSVSAAGAATPVASPSQQSGAQVAPTYLIPVPQAYQNLYLARPPK